MTSFTLSVIVIVLVASLLAAAYNSRMLKAAMRQLDRSEQLLTDSDRAAAQSIEFEFQRQDELLLLLARYAKPKREWSYLLHEFGVSLTEFLEKQRYHSVLPFHVAKAQLNLAQIMFLRGENRNALETLNKSISLASSVGDRTLTGNARNTLGCVYSTLGDFASAAAVLTESRRDLSESGEQGTALAITLRNLGLIKQILRQDGTEDVRSAISILMHAGLANRLGVEQELLQDFRMTLCEMYWARGDLESAINVSEQTLRELQTSLSHIDSSGMGKTLIARNRYVDAIRCVKRNLVVLAGITAGDKALEQPTKLGQPEIQWQWQRLCDLNTELVSNDLLVTGTMVAEFEQQNGLAMAWGMYGWSHDAIVEIARNAFDRTRLVIFADNEDSLEEAQSALQLAGVPLDSIQFRIEDCENPWFRDPGPIVSRSSSGAPIWFDSRLTRPGNYGRTVLDTLPRLLQRNWNTRVADLPIHIEGGMILSNGDGLVVASRTIIELNRAYGFSDESIVREIRRATGAKQLILVDPLIGEPTDHIDLFMTFVSPKTVVVGQHVSGDGPNAANLDRTATKLSQVVVGEQPLQVVRMAMPELGEQRFPSYTNVVFANGVLLVPSYKGVSRKLEADIKSTYEKLLSGWEVRFIDCSQLCERGGALHCLVSNLGHTKFTPAKTPHIAPQPSIPLD